MTVRILTGDCRDVLATLPENSVDAVVTDPPYGLTANKRGGTGVKSINLNSPYGRSRIGTGNGVGGFMGQKWDGSGIEHDPEFWAQVFAVAKPGAHLLAFGGTRTFHRIAVAIEDAGFEIRDTLMWLHSQGFPKSHDVSKAIDKAADYRLKAEVRRAAVSAVQEAGLQLPNNSRWDWTTGEHAPGDKWWALFLEWLPTLSDEDRERVERQTVETVRKSAGWFTSRDIYDITAPATPEAEQWEGWGTALKPSFEPIILARKPLAGTVAANVLTHGTGALNIDASRIQGEGGKHRAGEASQDRRYTDRGGTNFAPLPGPRGGDPAGRWPANVLLDEDAAAALDQMSGERKSGANGSRDRTRTQSSALNHFPGIDTSPHYGDTGGASRFFYVAKASRRERGEGNTHPTVKPLALMRWLVRLVTPPGGTVLDPFMGSGSTGVACLREGVNFIGIELNPEYAEIARRRITGDAPLFASVEVS